MSLHIFDCLIKKDLIKIKSLLSNPKFNINQKNYAGISALRLAAELDDSFLVSLLLTHPEIDVNASAKDGSTALLIASQSGQTDMVKMLLAHPKIDVHAGLNIAKDQTSPLTVACLTEHIDVVKILMDDQRIIDTSMSIDKLHQAFGNALEYSQNAAYILMIHPIYKQYGRPLSPPTIAQILYFSTRLNVKDVKEFLSDERVLVELLFRMKVIPSECYGNKISIPLLLGLMTYRDVIWRMLQPNDVQRHGVEISKGKLSTVNDIREELLINIYQSLNQPEENQHILYKVFFKEIKHSKNQAGFFKTTNAPTISALKGLIGEIMHDNLLSYAKNN